MEHDIYYERQRALIERSLQSEREREELKTAMRNYKREREGRKAYFKLQNTRRGKITRNVRTIVSWKGSRATMTKSERETTRTIRFPNSHITVYCRCRVS